MIRTLNIIYLDNDTAFFDRIKESLHSMDIICDLVFVSSVEEFRSTIMQVQFDLILCDYQLGKFLNGLDALSMAREICPDIPFLFYSEPVEELLVVEALKSGAIDFVLKQKTERLGFAISRALLEYKEKKELFEAQRQLADSEERFRTLVQAIPDIVYKIDADGHFLFVNNAVKKLGYNPEDLIGKHFSEILFADDVKNVSRSDVLPDFIGKVTGADSAPKLFDERRAGARQTKNLQVRLVRKDEKENKDLAYAEIYATGDYAKMDLNYYTWVEVNATGEYKTDIFRSDMNFQGTVGVIHDITESKKLEEQLRGSKYELEELNRDLEKKVAEEIAKNYENEMLMIKQSRQASMGEMLGNIAHQWRQPLNNIGLLIQNLETAYDTNAITADYIHKTVDKGVRIIQYMSQTIDDFRNFFKPNKEKVEFSVDEAVRKAYSILEAGLKNHGIEVKVDLSPNILANGYPNEFSQVVLNILLNAKDILKERSVKMPWIGLLLRLSNGKPVLEISDNGGGVHSSNMDKIFMPYFTTRADGTGIGLYMSKMIIEKNMGGKLSFRNSECGAVFTIEL